jgi:hypothetical protein
MLEFTEKELKNEIWKDIKNYEGMYQISNLGRVKSLPREVLKNGKYPFICKEKLLKPSIRKGYYRADLSKNASSKKYLIHVLVMRNFKPEEYQKCIDFPRIWVVDHIKEGNKLDNRLSNLQVITNAENTKKAKDKSKTSSKYFGVRWRKDTHKWSAYVYAKRQVKGLGSFNTELEAYEARKKVDKMIEAGDFSFLDKRRENLKNKMS